MKKTIALFTLIGLMLSGTAFATPFMAGKILLQVEQHGEAWYVHPETGERFYMARPENAYQIMRYEGIGITNQDLDRIADGSADESHKNLTFAKKHAGKIFLQVEERGEAWWINPDDYKKYYMKDGEAALEIMSTFGVGISDKDLANIPQSSKPIQCEGSISCYALAMENLQPAALQYQFDFNFIGLVYEIAYHQTFESKAGGYITDTTIDDFHIGISDELLAEIQADPTVSDEEVLEFVTDIESVNQEFSATIGSRAVCKIANPAEEARNIVQNLSGFEGEEITFDDLLGIFADTLGEELDEDVAAEEPAEDNCQWYDPEGNPTEEFSLLGL